MKTNTPPDTSNPEAVKNDDSKVVESFINPEVPNTPIDPKNDTEDFSITNNLNECVEAETLGAKIKAALNPFNTDTKTKASFELLVRWLILPWLNTLFELANDYMCSDDELTNLSPHRVPALGCQPAHFFSLFPQDEVICDPATDYHMTARQWLTEWGSLPATIYHHTRPPGGAERPRYFVLELFSGTLSNGAGFIIRYVQGHHGLRLRTVVKHGDTYYAWYDFPHGEAMDILDDLMTYGFDDFYVEHGNNQVPVPGLSGAEMIYNDI